VSASPEVLGQRSDGAYNGFSGAVDEVAFYNYALSASQITGHFANSTPLAFAKHGSNLVLSWSLGTLQSATVVNGPYSSVNNATSPYTNAIGASPAFFRLRLQ
jgi:hypothetical protein